MISMMSLSSKYGQITGLTKIKSLWLCLLGIEYTDDYVDRARDGNNINASFWQVFEYGQALRAIIVRDYSRHPSCQTTGFHLVPKGRTISPLTSLVSCDLYFATQDLSTVR